jgi:peptide-methionine (R)-S-oxide reductase
MTWHTTVAATIAVLAGTFVLRTQCAPTDPSDKETDMTEREKKSNVIGCEVRKTEAQWRQQLTDQEFYVTRRKGTERAFSGRYWKTKTPGVYHCVCCGQALYSSKAKFDSGTGWPSYWEPVNENAITRQVDRSHGMVRTELRCSRCGAHLGHVFDDGPHPTGQRHCINSAALNLVESDSASEKNPDSMPETTK